MLIQTSDYLPEKKTTSTWSLGYNKPFDLHKTEKIEKIRTQISICQSLNAIEFKDWQHLFRFFYFQLVDEDTFPRLENNDWITAGIGSCLLKEPQDFYNQEYSVALDRIKNLNQIEEIQDTYSIHLSGDVQHFLYINSGIAEIILEAYLYLENYFGPVVEIKPEVIQDPEIPEHEELMVYIVTCLPVDDALEKMNQFDQEWFLDQLDRFEADLNFNLEIL